MHGMVLSVTIKTMRAASRPALPRAVRRRARRHARPRRAAGDRPRPRAVRRRAAVGRDRLRARRSPAACSSRGGWPTRSGAGASSRRASRCSPRRRSRAASRRRPRRSSPRGRSQGLGAALAAPAALAMIVDAFPDGRPRERAVAAWTGVAAVGGAAGLVLGGVIAGARRLALDLPRQRPGRARRARAGRRASCARAAATRRRAASTCRAPPPRPAGSACSCSPSRRPSRPDRSSR